jgi:poly(A) polymerase
MVGFRAAGCFEPPNWMIEPRVTKVVDALAANGNPARFVGGCVRDTLLGSEIRDIDLATPERPDDVLKLLNLAHIKCIPTGLVHGTVTAVSGGRAIEITSLRKDVKTDGRRAQVEFTADWYEDAQRRDFTINALYCDGDGTFYDPVGGLADLKSGAIKFIGDPCARIREDYLRVLRFFRFFAWFGKGIPDDGALSACRETAVQLRNISGERIWAELSRLLVAATPMETLKILSENGVSEALFPGLDVARFHPKHVASMASVERYQEQKPDALRRLAIWMKDAFEAGGFDITKMISTVSSSLAHSRSERRRLDNMLRPQFSPGGDISRLENRKILYYLGDEIRYLDLVIFREALSAAQTQDWRSAAKVPITDPAPNLPIDGKDLMEMGLKQSPEIGKILGSVEREWVEGGFLATREILLNRLRERLSL